MKNEFTVVGVINSTWEFKVDAPVNPFLFDVDTEEKEESIVFQVPTNLIEKVKPHCIPYADVIVKGYTDTDDKYTKYHLTEVTFLYTYSVEE